MSELDTERVVTSGYLSHDRAIGVDQPDGIVHREASRLSDNLIALETQLDILSARLVHVVSPTDSVLMIGQVRDSKPKSPLADRLEGNADHVARLCQRAESLVAALEV